VRLLLFQFIVVLIAGVDYKIFNLVETSRQHLIILFCGFAIAGVFHYAIVGVFHQQYYFNKANNYIHETQKV